MPSHPQLGLGAYSLSEVSRLADLPPSTARSWFLGRSDGSGRGPVLHGDFGRVDTAFAVSFLDLIDAMVVGRFRKSGVMMSTIREAYAILSRELEAVHPFAHSKLRTDGKAILLEEADRLGNRWLFDVVTKQMIFEYLHDGLERIDYSALTKLAERFRISEGIVLDPKVGFGKPVIENTATHAGLIARQYNANDHDAALVADLYEISESDVINAVCFGEVYGTLAA